MRKTEKNHPGVLSPEGFKQALQKYASRHAKGDAVFAVLSLRVSNYGQLVSREGTPATQLVCDSLLRACLNGLRQQDRVCLPQSDLFLFLLPDTDESGALKAQERLTSILSQAQTRHCGKTLKAEGQLAMSHCGATACDIDGMLQAVGATLDEHGALVGRTDGAAPARIANLDSWCERYAGFSTENGQDQSLFVTDRWSGLPVVVRKIKARLPGHSWDEVVKRARVLQSINHPALSRIIDFHCEEQLQVLYIVRSQTAGVPLCDVLSASAQIAPGRAMHWMNELVGALSYLQGLVPPAVPAELSAAHLLVGGDSESLIFSEVLDGYIFNEGRDNSFPALLGQVGLLFESIAARTEADKLPEELTEIIARLKQKEIPAQLSTMHKLRAAVRKIVERVEKQPAAVQGNA